MYEVKDFDLLYCITYISAISIVFSSMFILHVPPLSLSRQFVRLSSCETFVGLHLSRCKMYAMRNQIYLNHGAMHTNTIILTMQCNGYDYV